MVNTIGIEPGMAQPLPDTLPQLPELQHWVKARCGLQFEGQDAPKLLRAVQQRSQALGLTMAAYPAQVMHGAHSDAEFQELVNLLTINETYFFRESEQIDLLVQRILPRLLARSGGHEPIRILSAGCSTGEEPYSLAMALLEKYGDAMVRWFTLLGADIDSHALSKARAACYSDFSFRGVPAHIRARYFAPLPSGGWQLQPQVRQQVTFHELNLLSGAAPQALQQCDVILFRNVSIYFDTPTRRQIQEHLAALLKHDGIVMIGTAETLANDLGVLTLVEEDGLFYFTKGTPPLAPHTQAQPRASLGLGLGLRSASTPPPAPTVAPTQPPSPLTLPAGWQPVRPPAPVAPPPQADADDESTHALAQAREALGAQQYAQAQALLEPVLARQPQHTEALLLKAYALLEHQDFAAAQTLAEQVLQAQPWSVDACVLLGLAAKWRDDAPGAVRWLRQAIYAEHACWPAHYFLADVLRSQGTPEALQQAQRSWRVVLQLLGAPGAAAAPVATGLRYLPLELPVGQVRFLCERHLRPGHSAGGTLAERGD